MPRLLTARERLAKRPVKYVAEYAGLRLAAALIRRLPAGLALGVAWALARLTYHVLRFRVRRARARIREVFGERLAAREVNRIAWLSMRNMFFNAVEFMKIPRLTRRWFATTVDHEAAIQALKRNVEDGRGAILAIPHMGNWELAGVGAHALGVPVFFITGRQHNPLVDAYLRRLRTSTGIEAIPRGDAAMLKQVVRNLRAGNILGFTNDVRSRTQGLTVRFLGKTANVVGGMALFARQARVPIFPAVALRRGWRRHEWRVFDPVHPDPGLGKEADWQRMTQQVMDIYSRAIEAEPEQFFWYNNRWILFPYPPPPRGEKATAARAINR